jgi:hypothetical protein
VQAQVEELYFIFNLEYRYVALSRGMLHRLSIKSHTQQKPKYLSEMTTHTPYLTEPGKMDGPVWTDELQRLVFKYWMFQFLLASFQRLVFGRQV